MNDGSILARKLRNAFKSLAGTHTSNSQTTLLLDVAMSSP